MTDELKNCPFCGQDEAIIDHSDDGKWYFGLCVNCGAEGPADLGESGAIESWNTRPIENALRAEHARCQELYADAETRADAAGAEARDLRIEVERLKEIIRNTFDVLAENINGAKL